MLKHLSLQLVAKQQLAQIKHSLKLHTSRSTLLIRKDQYKEIKIPVPWGHIAGKWWGKTDIQPMLALHGVQDNAATFDKIIPLLDTDAVLALDIPGHGWSSHIPIGCLYNFLEAVAVVRMVIKDHFKWQKPVNLLTHSFGSVLSFVYASSYPDEVAKYISIDCARHVYLVWPNTTISALRELLDKTLDIENKTTTPEYTYDELLQLLYTGRNKTLTKDSCETLLSRGITRLKNGKMYFSRDVRVKLYSCGRFTTEHLLEIAPKIKCDVLSIQASEGLVKPNAKGDFYKKTLDIINKNSAKSKHVILEGKHHIHLDTPEVVAIEINKFLSN